MKLTSKSVLATLMLSSCLTTGAMAQTVGAPTDPRTYRTLEFRTSWGLWMSSAEYAYAMGVDGSGVEVGVIDSGVDVGHSELKGQVSGGYDYVTRSPAIIDRIGHGTAVASIIAGKRDGIDMHGMAPGARIVSARILDDEGSMAYDDPIVGEAWSALLDRGVRILNNSWGGVDEAITDYSLADMEARAPNLLAASRSAVERGGLVVFITHNSGLSQPGPEAGLPHLFPELERGWLAVTAVGYSGELAGYANACGVAKTWCLAAPGGDFDVDGFGIPAAIAGGGYGEAEGTSFAAPHVSGAAALVWQMFPNFTADQVRQTLLGTARDIGAPGVDELYGYGLLNAGKAVLGPGRFDWGDFHVVQPTGTSVWYNDISGAGGLIKSGSGTLVLNGDNTYSGPTRVDEGRLAVMGSITSPTFVGYDGMLAGRGTVRGAVWNEGYVTPGNASLLGALTIDGDFVNTETGLIVGQIVPGGLTNQLAITGAADLEGGAVGVLITPGLYRTSFTQALVTAGQGVTGRFEALLTDDYAFLKPSLSYDAGAVYLTLTRLRFDDRSVCVGANACAVGGALERGLDTGDTGFLGGAIALQGSSSDQARASLESLSGEAHASLATIALTGGLPLDQTLSARLGDLRAGKLGASDDNAWARAYGQWGRLGAGSDTSGADYQTGGLIVGRDWEVSPSMRVGASFSYSATDVDFDRFGGRGEVKAYEGALYSAYVRGAFGLDSWLSYARLTNEVGRDLVIGDQSRRATADYDGERIGAFAEASYAFDLGGVTARPLASLRYGRLHQDGFTEEGVGSLGLAGEEQNLDSLQSGLGVSLSAPLPAANTSGLIEARAKWLHEFLDDHAELDGAFIGAPASGFASRGAQVGRDSALLGVGVSARAGAHTVFFANYDAKLNTDDAAHAATLGLRITW